MRMPPAPFQDPLHQEHTKGPSQELLDSGWKGNAALDELYDRVGAPKLGAGVYGSVYQAKSRVTGELVAIKRMVNSDHPSGEIPGFVIREVSLLRDFVHPNIARLIDMHIHSDDEFHLVFEHVDNDLHRELKARRRNKSTVHIWQLAKWSLDLLNGIQACHVRLILHRDLKPQNILVSASMQLKICDFGISRLHQPLSRQRYSSDVVTLWYRSPELLLGCTGYGPEVDMWSIGCIVGEMATGCALFHGTCEIDTIFQIFMLCGTPVEEPEDDRPLWPGVSQLGHFKKTFPKWDCTDFEDLVLRRPDLKPDGQDLLRGLLSLDPKKRLTARKAKTHKCFDKFR